MLEGFNDITQELSQYEKEVLLPKIVAGLSTKKGKHMAITNKKICEAMKNRGFEIADTRLRKLVEYIREHQIIPGLLASSKGYWISTDPEEVRNYLKSIYGRKSALQMIEQRMTSYLLTLERKAS